MLWQTGKNKEITLLKVEQTENVCQLNICLDNKHHMNSKNLISFPFSVQYK